MTLQPLLAAAPAVQIHVVAVTLALVAGTWMLLARKGTAQHRTVGRAYLALMLTAAAVTVFIPMGGGYGWLHLLSVGVVSAVVYGWSMARRGAVRAHRQTMIGLYVGGLLVAGFFAFMPGRIMHRVIFG